MTYRDPLAAVRGRIAELVIRVQELEASLSDAYWRTLTAAERERIAKWSSMVCTAHHAADLESMTAKELELTRYLHELEARVRRLPELEAMWQALPQQVFPPEEERRLFSLGWRFGSNADELAQAFRDLVHRRDPEARITFTNQSMLAELVDGAIDGEGVPMALHVTAETHQGQVLELISTLVTSVRRSMPRLTLRSESFASTITKAVGLRREIEIGDLNFDGMFLIDGDRKLPREVQREQVLPVLDAPLKAAILALARFDVPTLTIDPDTSQASVTWKYPEFQPRALGCAAKILTLLRAQPGTVRLRK